MIAIVPFLTAYDPSDLPGASIDPLGFERGYLHLAEKFLPGLTNVANKPRYFGLLCAGVRLADVSPTDTPRTLYERRSVTVQRLERLWALSNVLVAQKDEVGAYPVNGIRGLRYAQRKAAVIAERRESKTSANFQLLGRQAAYGALGIYGSVAERLRFLQDRRTLSLTPDLGDRLGEAFIDETDMSPDIRAAARDDRPVSIDRLREWGERAHVAGACGYGEAACLAETLNSNPIRSRITARLTAVPSEAGEEEQERLARMLRELRGHSDDVDLAETIEGIIAYEKAYRVAQLGLERLLWLCSARDAVPVQDTYADPIIAKVQREIPAATRRFNRALNDATTEHFLRDNHRLDDVKRFLTDLTSASEYPADFVAIILQRHRDVQHGKFDRGRRKAPWLDQSNEALSLTMTRVGGASVELTHAKEVIPHYYRTVAADALCAAGMAE